MYLLAILFTLFSVVQGFTITTPSGWNSGRNATMTWTSAASDPDNFSVELMNPTLLYNQLLAIATTLKKTDGSYTFGLPSVPTGDGYTLQFVNVSDITHVYATSGSFSISNGTASSTSSSASVSTASVVTSTGSSTANTSAPSAQTTATQSGSANKVGPAAALAVALTALGFSTLGF